MKIDIKELIEYFDLKESTDYGDTTAVISVVGEDLSAAIFKHYCESQIASKVDIIDSNKFIPTTLKKIGRRLDRWILVNRESGNILYQTEIKNWCSRAIGGINIPPSSEGEELDKLAEKNWVHHLIDFESKEGNGLNKVLIDMVSDKNLNINDSYQKEPLLILWHVAKPIDEKKFFFKYYLSKKYFDFKYCWIFSCSLYLRCLLKNHKSKIEIEMPNVSRRIKQLIQIFKL